jgi:Mrp family chromosome partitioning ATPase
MNLKQIKELAANGDRVVAIDANLRGANLRGATRIWTARARGEIS